ncbi:uncharacterized protein LOC128736728 [Sabethes cyaneus]|uniref:uncharacterized protein LOC128736728 n=1 Tax=Sabethes cyaneus TaxID=53552 RepID=UPI00237E7BF6|nr:uncharacterized protein LOC128736728 [Sabethes cyaneus]
MDCNGVEDCAAAAADEPPSIPRVDVVYLSYNCKRIRPTIALDNVCTVSLYELKKHRKAKKNQKTQMSYDAYQHYKWYNTVLSKQLKEGGGPMLLKVFHWYIESSHGDAFEVNACRYDAVSLIIAAHVEHFYCAKAGCTSAQGRRLRLGDQSTDQGPDSTACAKARIADCLVPSTAASSCGMVNARLLKQCSKRLSLGTISEE